MNINIDKKDFEYKQYDIDQLLNGSESREVNKYFGIYKLNILCVGGSGSGKTTWIINQILNDIFDCDVILCFIPHETLYSGFYQSLLHSEHFYKPILVFEIGHDKQFNGLDNAESIPIKSQKRSNYIIQGMPTVSQLYQIKNDLKFKSPLCIFDDFVNVLNKQMFDNYYRYIHNISRLNGKICSCVQAINKIPPQVRSSYTIVVLFTHYLTHSVITTMLRNCVNNPMLDKKNTDYLLDLIDKDPNKHNPLIVIGGDVDQKKSIIYNNNYITFT